MMGNEYDVLSIELFMLDIFLLICSCWLTRTSFLAIQVLCLDIFSCMKFDSAMLFCVTTVTACMEVASSMYFSKIYAHLSGVRHT